MSKSRVKGIVKINSSTCCFLSRLPVSTVKTLIAEHGTLYRQIGMKPKYTGYIPRKLLDIALSLAYSFMMVRMEDS